MEAEAETSSTVINPIGDIHLSMASVNHSGRLLASANTALDRATLADRPHGHPPQGGTGRAMPVTTLAGARYPNAASATHRIGTRRTVAPDLPDRPGPTGWGRHIVVPSPALS